MKITLFAIVSFFAILFMAAVRIVFTGRIDHHFGLLGSILKTIPSSVVTALITSLAFWLVSLRTKGHRSTRSYVLLGGLTGLASYAFAWALSDHLRGLGSLVILLPFAVFGALASLYSKQRNG